ncbi:MAG: 30S ribosomal protein S9 [Nanoarchaeota archaeon]|nr:30S ribosomal protein S9 [Nanoarchaeota archaeon]
MIKKETISGKRKTSIAKAQIQKGEGVILINGKRHDLLNKFHKLSIEEPIRLAKKVLGKFEYDVFVKVRGGGRESRIEAARLAIAKVILSETKSKELKKVFSEYDKYLLVADTRRKEVYKPGDSKARAKRQSSKR